MGPAVGNRIAIRQNFELLCLEEVYGAIAYYLANRAEIDAYPIRLDEKWAEGRRQAEPLPADLRERLRRASPEDLHTIGDYGFPTFRCTRPVTSEHVNALED